MVVGRDLDRVRKVRDVRQFFHDERPEMYGDLTEIWMWSSTSGCSVAKSCKRGTSHFEARDGGTLAVTERLRVPTSRSRHR